MGFNSGFKGLIGNTPRWWTTDKKKQLVQAPQNAAFSVTSEVEKASNRRHKTSQLIALRSSFVFWGIPSSMFCPKDRLFWFLFMIFCSPPGKFLVFVMKCVVTLPSHIFQFFRQQSLFLSTLFNLCLRSPCFMPVHFTPFCSNAPW